jgi:PAX-interacting protein 1
MLHQQHLKQQQEQKMMQTQHQQLKQQFQQRQMQVQLMQKQQIIQQQQLLHQQSKQQLSAQLQTHQMPQLHQINDVNDLKMRQGLGVKPGVFQQHISGGRSAYQQLKPGASFPFSSPQLLQAASPQIPQHSSLQVDQQNLLSSLTKAGTPLQSANSPFVVPSPSTPMAPSPMPGDSEKPVSGVSSLSNAGNIGYQQKSDGAPAPSLAIGTSGISASPLLAEFTAPDGTYGNATMNVSGKSSITEQPLERLIKVVS